MEGRACHLGSQSRPLIWTDPVRKDEEEGSPPEGHGAMWATSQDRKGGLGRWVGCKWRQSTRKAAGQVFEAQEWMRLACWKMPGAHLPHRPAHIDPSMSFAHVARMGSAQPADINCISSHKSSDRLVVTGGWTDTTDTTDAWLSRGKARYACILHRLHSSQSPTVEGASWGLCPSLTGPAV